MTPWILVIIAFAGVGVAMETQFAALPAEMAYHLMTALQLVAILLAVLVVFAGVSSLAIRAVERLVQPRLLKSYTLLLGWNLLRSQRTVVTWRFRIGRWVDDFIPANDRLRRDTALTLVAGVLAIAAVNLLPHWIPPATPNAEALLTFLRLSAAGIGALFMGRGLLSIAVFLGFLQRQPPIQGEPPNRQRVGVTLPNFISMVGVGIGVWALIMVMSVMSGFEQDLRSKILATNAHVLVTPKKDVPADQIPSARELTSRLSAVEGVESVSPFLEEEAMISSPFNTSVNLTIRGIEPEGASATELYKRLILGDLDGLATAAPEPTRAAAPIEPTLEFPEDGELVMPPIPPPGASHPAALPEGVVLGSELANSLRVELGSEIRLISLDGEIGPTGIRPRARTFRVIAIFQTGMYEFDLKLAFISRPAAQDFFRSKAEANRVELRLLSPADPGPVTHRIAESLPAGMEVRNWQELNRNLFAALKLEKIAMFLVLGFIVLVASFNILASLAMLIQEKAKEIAILKSMGATNQGVMGVFLMLGLFLGLIGALCGTLLGVGCCVLIERLGVPLPTEYYIPTIPVDIHTTDVAAAACSAMLICLLATIYPSIAASRLDPVEGLRHD